ncbi:MAG: 3-dehydroquinate synthase [Candidatus Diapherotrites archaeon]|nr:3-dehydroquinate synthase [Candidatus Diapherotrites archaeon]
MYEASFGRDCCVVAFGGGVVGDLAGFIAANFKRGIPLVQIPTTLLAMADSSIGGKNAVNLPAGKNMLGSIHQPEKILMDIALLETLPEQEIRNGLAEALKTGIAMDSRLFELIEKNSEKAIAKDQAVLSEIVVSCARAKLSVVQRDEQEHNLRKTLNFGHTVGHALEALEEFNVISHGEAIAAGVRAEARIAERIGILPAAERERIEGALEKIGFREMPLSNPERLMEFMERDKKNSGKEIRMALPERIGKMHSAGGNFAVPVARAVILEAFEERGERR